jgi:hypothetical protein
VSHKCPGYTQASLGFTTARKPEPVDPHVWEESEKKRLTGQNLWVLERLRKGPLTPIEAMQEHNIMRLAARILDLRKAGYWINSESLENGVSRYTLTEVSK